MNKVSVIVPIYKIPEYALRSCIESLLLQSYSDIEILLVDDGSPDNCGSICDQYASQDSRVISLHKANGGVSSARNLGLDKSTGDYILFVDGDDAIHYDCISTMVNIAVEEASDIVVCGYMRFFTEKVPFDKAATDEKKYSTFTKEEDLRCMQRKCLIEDDLLGARFNGSPWCKLYRSDLIKNENYRFDTSLVRSQDNFFNLHIFGKAKKICYTPNQLYFYRHLAQSAVNRFRPNLFEISDRYLTCVANEIEKQNLTLTFKDTYEHVRLEKLGEFFSTYAAHKDNHSRYSKKINAMKKAYNSWIPDVFDIYFTVPCGDLYAYVYKKCLKKQWFHLLYAMIKAKGFIRILYYKYKH